MNMLSITIVITSIIGFGISAYIRYKRIKQEPLVCFIRGDCNKVVNSRYAVTFGIPNEITGMLYYGLTALSFTIFPFMLAPSHLFSVGFPVIAGIATAFSFYLVILQLTVLKQWCEWCITSGVLSAIIFLLAIL